MARRWRRSAAHGCGANAAGSSGGARERGRDGGLRWHEGWGRLGLQRSAVACGREPQADSIWKD
jgi:hypothetical protein